MYLNFVKIKITKPIPDMSFTVGMGGKGEITNDALEWACTAVRAHMSDERTLIRTAVDAQVTLVQRLAHVTPHVTCNSK